MMVLKEFSRIVCVSLFSYQGSLFVVLRQLVYFITVAFVCQQLFKFFQNFFNKLRYPLLISNSFTLSHSFLNVKYFLKLFIFQNQKLQTEKEGFEPSRRLPDLYP